MFMENEKIKEFFTVEECEIIKDAIEDHRASIEHTPRNIYGKILSSADRNTSIDSPLRRTYAYRRFHNPSSNVEEIINDSRLHLIDKYGNTGYAREKMFFDDPDYRNFLEQMSELLQDEQRFVKEFVRVNNLENELLKNSIISYIPFNEQEAKDKESIISLFDNFTNPLTRDNIFGHITASAFVTDENEERMLLVKHNIFGGFIYPGGHADGNYNLLEVAIREVLEETGINVSPLFNGSIFSIQSLPIKGHLKNGKYISAHVHYDILYALKAKTEDIDKIRVLESENSEVKWVYFDSLVNEDLVDWIRPINDKIVKKFRMRGK